VALGVLFIVNSGALQPVLDGEYQRGAASALRKNPQLTAEQMQSGRAMMEKVTKVITFIVIPITLFLLGLTIWVVAKFFDAKISYTQATLIASFAYVPRVLETVINGVQGLLLDPASMNGRYRISLGVGRFFDPDVASPMLLAIVGRIDLFTIWVTVLLVIGLAVIGKISRRQAAIAGVIVWIIGAVPGIIGAARA